MALTKNVNSYCTVAEADAYFADRLDVAAWNEADEMSKSQALVSATMLLDTVEFNGYAVSTSQMLAFPRVVTYYNPRLGVTTTLDSTSGVPNEIIKACNELAYHLLNNDGLLDDTGSVENLSISGINLVDVKSAQRMPTIVRELIKPFKKINTGTWWRAN